MPTPSKTLMTKSGSKAAKAKKAAARPLNRVAQMKAKKNQDMVQDAVNGDLLGVIYGRVEKHFGHSRIQVLTSDLITHLATIRNILRNKRATRIDVGDVVILSPRDFETTKGEINEDGIAADDVFDVIGVMDRKAAKKLQRNGEIPAWMTGAQTAEEIMNPKAGGAGDEEGFYFDYESDDDSDSEESEGADAPATAAPTRDLPPAYSDPSWTRASVAAAKKSAILPNGDIDIDLI
jgi:translation initiation factor IF-1